MKYLIFAFFGSIISIVLCTGQTPQVLNYQLILRNSEGNVMQNKTAILRTSILESSETGTVKFSEIHNITSNNFGLVSIKIGEGDIETGDFENIDWSSSQHYLKIEMDLMEGDGFINMGAAQLVAVPYAMHANTVTNADDADSDPTNEFQVLSISGDTIFLSNGGFIVLPTVDANDADADPENELQTLSIDDKTIYLSNGGSVILPDDEDNDPTNEYQTITFHEDSLGISSGNKIKLPLTDTTWRFSGSDLYFNSGKVGIGTDAPSSKLVVKGDETTVADDLLFAVVNNFGDTVFAVFQGGVRIYVDDNPSKAIGNKGGFAVGGFSSGKGTITQEYLMITPDSVRIYVDDDATKAVGNKGGFAVGGFSSGKGLTNEFLRISPDSVRIYVDDDATKAVGNKGGFAVGGFSSGKSSYTNEFLRVSPDSVRIYVDDDATKAVGNKGGFAVGGFSSGKSGLTNEFLRISPDSVRIYIDDNVTKAVGNKGGFAIGGFDSGKGGVASDYFNISGNTLAQVINPSEARVLWYPKKEAFMAGRVIVESPDSVGFNSWATGFESKSIGDYSQALGYQARAYGNNSTAIGNIAIVDSANSYAFGNNTYVGSVNSYAIGNGANVTGESSYAFGSGAEASGDFSFAFGSDGVDSAGVATNSTRATADYSYALGMGSVASNNGAFAFGTLNTASGYFSTAIGYNSIASGYYGSTAIGYITSAFGNYGATAIGYKSAAQGDYSIAIGVEAMAINWYSVAIGDRATASGYNATAIGKETLAEGNISTAMGSNTKAIGGASIAMGHKSIAQGNYASTAIGYQTLSEGAASLSLGYNTIARGINSTAIGRHTIAKSYGETVIGTYNDTTQSTDPINQLETDPLFVVGNGTADTYRLNAFMVLKSGNTGIGGYPGATGLNVFAIKNGIAPDTPITNGILLYSVDESASAELQVMDEAGNVSTLSPHNFSLIDKSEPMAWSFYSENKNVGYKINVDMLKAMRTIEKLSGEKLVYMQDIDQDEIIKQEKSESLIDLFEKQNQEIEELKYKNSELNDKHNNTLNELEQLKIEVDKLKKVVELNSNQ
jgi:trimeric autotransporter adhesin